MSKAETYYTAGQKAYAEGKKLREAQRRAQKRADKKMDEARLMYAAGRACENGEDR